MNAMQENAPIVITMGDPSGVGPEVTVKALAALDPRQRESFAIIGDGEVLGRAIAASGVSLDLAPPEQRQAGGVALIDVPVEGLPHRFGVLSDGFFTHRSCSVRTAGTP